VLNGKVITSARVWVQSHITRQDSKQGNVALAFHLIVRVNNRYISYAVLDQTLIFSSLWPSSTSGVFNLDAMLTLILKPYI
jgi:hypothetical protein